MLSCPANLSTFLLSYRALNRVFDTKRVLRLALSGKLSDERKRQDHSVQGTFVVSSGLALSFCDLAAEFLGVKANSGTRP